MKKVLMLSIVLLFFVGSINAQGVRDDDSYSIHFEWTDGRPDVAPPGGYGNFLDGYVSITAARTNRGFNVYAQNNKPDTETGAPIENHSAYPVWYAGKGWDVPDADAGWSNGTRYLVTIDTYQEKWWLIYIDYPYPNDEGVVDIYVPMSGFTEQVTFNDDGTIDIELKEDGGDWNLWWGIYTPWGFEDIKLDGKGFVAHIDTVLKTGYIAPILK